MALVFIDRGIDMSLFSNPQLKGLSFQLWLDSISEADSRRIYEMASNSGEQVNAIYALAQEIGYKRTCETVNTWFKKVHGNNSGKHSPLRTNQAGISCQAFIDNLSDEDKETFIAHANQPNVTIAELHSHLHSLGYEGSYQVTKKWKSNLFCSGNQAKRINEIVEQYQGINQSSVLDKTVADLVKLQDTIIESIDDRQIEKEGLRVLPSLIREMKGCIESQNKLQFINEIKAIQRESVMWFVEKLRYSFKDTGVEHIVDEVIEGILDEMNQRHEGMKGG